MVIRNFDRQSQKQKSSDNHRQADSRNRRGGVGSRSRSATHADRADHGAERTGNEYADEEVEEDEDVADDSDYERGGMRKISRDDLQDLAKVGSELFKRTITSGFDIFKEVSKELPKEATQFISARKDQVLQNMTKDLAQVMLSNAMERFFSLVREHRLEVSFRIVRDKQVAASNAAESGKSGSLFTKKKSRRELPKKTNGANG